MRWPSPAEARVLYEVLRQGEAYGLSIVKGASVPRGSVYVLLDRLEAKGFIESCQEEVPASDGYVGVPRRLYRATALGRKLHQALKELSRS